VNAAGKANRRDRDAGSIMPMTTVLIAFLMLSAWALVSASEQWGARRDAYAAASAAARAGAQADPEMLRQGALIDDARARERALAVLTAAGYSGTVEINGEQVTVTVSAPVDYAFPSPGFPGEVRGSATAVARRGVVGDEGG
jgi:hypothetical protein